jgi:5-methylcytosine-specific restriction endonuclease McrA
MGQRKTTRLKKSMFGKKQTMPCEYCGRTLTMQTATFDHVTPVSKGGYTKKKNGALACRTCNQMKGSLNKGEFFQKAIQVASQLTGKGAR